MEMAGKQTSASVHSSDPATPPLKRWRGEGAQASSEHLLPLLSEWAKCSTLLKRARTLARIDSPSARGPPYSVPQLVGWGERYLKNADDSTPLPTPAILQQFCADSLNSLVKHVETLVDAERSHVLNLLEKESSESTSQYASLPRALKEVLLRRHGPDSSHSCCVVPCVGDGQELAKLEDLVNKLRVQRAILDKLGQWKALLTPREDTGSQWDSVPVGFRQASRVRRQFEGVEVLGMRKDERDAYAEPSKSGR